ncbi:MAG: glycosyltransferase family A protein [Negativicutes bacterium]|jgi:glycosyltransferase involved in cell wall biosynthesis
MQVSVIIPTYNREKYLLDAIESIINQNISPSLYEIIVVDNSADGGARDIVEKKYGAVENVKYVHEPAPGLHSARHRGVVESIGEILIFVDDDIIADPQWLNSILETFDKYLNAKIVGGKSIPKYEVAPPAWTEYLWDRALGNNICGYWSLVDFGDVEKEITPNYVWGLNFSIRRETYFELGGMHPDVIPKHLQRFQGDGETGLTYKIIEKGYKAYYQPKAQVQHVIPVDRMTEKYFEDRMFYQGVCKSFTEIRKCESESKSNFQQMIESEKLEVLVFAKIKKLIKMLAKLIMASMRIFKIAEKSPAKIYCDYMIQKMYAVYNAGYEFHQNEVKNDIELLNWVLRDNYFD